MRTLLHQELDRRLDGLLETGLNPDIEPQAAFASDVKATEYSVVVSLILHYPHKPVRQVER